MSLSQTMPPAPLNLFLDRDGAVIVDKHYLCQAAEVELIPGVGPALGAACAAGHKLFMVTNQSGIGRGFFLEDDFQAVQARLEELLAPFGAKLQATRFCPHNPQQEECDCRKPGLGMWHELQSQYNLDPATCYMFGDKNSDLEFGLQARFAGSILLLSGHGEKSAAKLGLKLTEGQNLEAVPSLDKGQSKVWLATDLGAAVTGLGLARETS